MVIIDYNKKNHKQIIHACAAALKIGKSVVYPTDTCYGLAVDTKNIKAVKRLYQIKDRDFKKPIHVVVPSIAYAKTVGIWNASAVKLAKKFWPGALTLVLCLVGDGLKPSPTVKMLSANTGSIGLRMPKNQIALDLAKQLGSPITATSANVSGNPDCYSVEDILSQFKKEKYKPDIIINAGRLKKTKPSTLVRIFDDVVKVLREGPVTEKQILMSLRNTK